MKEPTPTVKLSDLPADKLAKAEHLIGTMRDVELPKPLGYQVLCLLYIREQKSKGGIIFADQTKQEDIYQGRCGLVLDFGPDAYSDATRFPKGRWIEAGDWVMWPPVEAARARVKYGDLVLAFVNDDALVAAVPDPEQTVKG